MDDGDAPASRGGTGTGVRRHLEVVARSLRATPAELVGLALLLLGGVVCLAVLVWWSSPRAQVAAGGGAVPVAVTDGSADAASAASVTVHVVGAVGRPGVVSLPAGARVVDAIAAAGEATLLADLGSLNLARAVTDGERIEVPTFGAPAGAADTPSDGVGDAFLPDGRLDLNRATAADLETLSGIGPVLAQRIVSHREEHGPFARAGDLRGVPGIGEATFQRLADLIVVP